MTPAQRLAALPPAAREAAIAALDEISRPMTKIEIENALQPALPRSQRRPVARALAALEIIMIARQ